MDVCKLSSTGIVIWSTLIKPGAYVYGPLEGNEVDKVYERLDPNTGKYEYYGVAASYYSKNPSGSVYAIKNLVVFKLNDLGGITVGKKNEFHYLAGSTAPQGPGGSTCAHSDLTGIQTGGSGDGFQAFGTDTSLNRSKHFFIRSYFNGEVGCRDTSLFIDSIFTGPHLMGTLNVSKSVFSQCAAGSLNVTALTPAYNQICYANSLAAGSNARALGIATVNGASGEISVYPNPVRNKARVSIPESVHGPVTAVILNNLGQKVSEYNFENVTDREFEIDFSALGVKTGFYFLQISASNLKSSYKIIYEAE